MTEEPEKRIRTRKPLSEQLVEHSERELEIEKPYTADDLISTGSTLLLTYRQSSA